MYRFYLAFRFMLNRPINLLAMIGVMLGVWSLIVVVSIFDGYADELTSHVSTTSSDLVVFGLSDRIEFEAVRELLERDENVEVCAPRIVWHGMLHPRTGARAKTWIPGALAKEGRFVSITGIDPTLEARTTGFSDWLRGARDDPELSADWICDPAKLAEKKNWVLVSTLRAEFLKVGEKLKATTARVFHTREGTTMRSDLHEFKVAGAFKSLHAGFDSLTVFVPIAALRELVTAKGGSEFVNEVTVKLKSTAPEAAKQTRARLARAMHADPAFLAARERPSILIAGQTEARTLESIHHQSGLLKIVLFVIMVVAGFLVYATLSEMVAEKVHDIGVVSALGGTRAGVLQIFVSCGLAITLFGTALGIAIGCFTSIHLDDFNRWMKRTFDIDLFPPDIYGLPNVPHTLDPQWIATVSLASVLLGILASLIPAWRAMRNDPLDCLRNG